MVNVYGRNSMSFSGVVSLISLSEHSRFVLFVFVWSVFLHVGFYLLHVGFWWFLCWWFFSSSSYTDVLSSHLFLYVVSGGSRQNGLRQQEGILWDLKYQHIEKR